MHTARYLAFAAIAGCGPMDVTFTTTSNGDAGEESSTSGALPGSTGLGGSESGPVDTPTSHGASSSGADSSSTTGGGGSSSSGGPPPVCLVDPPGLVCVCDGVETEPESTPLGCFCGDVEMSPDACCLPVEQEDGVACFCYGEQVDPSECSCFDGQDGCECPGFETSDKPCLVPPTDPCMYDVTNATCACDGIPSDPSLCDCETIDAECACDGFPAPAEFCAVDCVLVGEGDVWSCTCDGDLADPAACGCPATGDPDCICAGASCGPCVPIGAMCLCGDFVAPPEAC